MEVRVALGSSLFQSGRPVFSKLNKKEVPGDLISEKEAYISEEEWNLQVRESILVPFALRSFNCKPHYPQACGIKTQGSKKLQIKWSLRED
jgi:hypothetical protein